MLKILYLFVLNIFYSLTKLKHRKQKKTYIKKLKQTSNTIKLNNFAPYFL